MASFNGFSSETNYKGNFMMWMGMRGLTLYNNIISYRCIFLCMGISGRYLCLFVHFCLYVHVCKLELPIRSVLLQQEFFCQGEL